MRALFLALALVALFSLAGANREASFELVGRSAHLKLVSGNSTLDVRVGRVYEVDSGGIPVQGHRLPALASLQPAISNGTRVLNGSTVSFVTLTVGLASVSSDFNAACPGGGASIATIPLSAATVNVTVFYNVTSNLTLGYGNGVVNVPAGSVKFNIEAGGWPFCSAANQLMVELSIFTSREADEPVLFDDSASSTTTSTQPATARRLLLKARDTTASSHQEEQHQQQQQQQQEDHSPNGGRVDRPDPHHPPARPEGHGGDGPRPGGRAPRLLTALMSAQDAAAMDLQTVAFDSATAPTITYNVSIYVPPAKQEEDVGGGATKNVTRVTLGFPAFNTTLYYDPTVGVETSTSLGYTVNTTTTAATTTGAAGAPSVRGLMAVLAGAATLLIALA